MFLYLKQQKNYLNGCLSKQKYNTNTLANSKGIFFCIFATMAKKIIISFNAQPVLGVAFGYNILIDNVKVLYNSGVNFIDASYAANATTPQVLKLQPTLAENIANTLFTLNTFFQSAALTYTTEGNTIVVLINNNTVEVQLINGLNPSMSLQILDVPVDTLRLKYFLQYVNIVGDSYLCNILKKNYTGVSTEIFGVATIEKGSVKDHLEPIRGTGLVLELEANNGFIYRKRTGFCSAIIQKWRYKFLRIFKA